jgi:hypothetical protein
LCQPCAYGGTDLNVIKGIGWQTTLHGEGVVFYENIRITCLIITKSTIWITIKPCKCDQRLILLKVEDVNNQPTLCRGLFQSISIGWSSPTWWCKCECSALNRVLRKTTSTPTTYAQVFSNHYNHIIIWIFNIQSIVMNDITSIIVSIIVNITANITLLIHYQFTLS